MGCRSRLGPIFESSWPLDSSGKTRMAALLFLAEYTRLTGASKPGTSRRYELVDGDVNASSAAEWARSPPM